MRDQRIKMPAISLDPGTRTHAQPILAAEPPRLARGLARLSRPRDVPRGTSIAEQGRRDTWMHLVVAGAFKAWAVARGGSACIVEILGPGDVVGVLSPAGDEPSPVTVTALVDGRVLGAPAAEVHALVLSDPVAMMEVVRRSELRRLRMSRRLSHVLLGDTDEVVLACLRTLASDHGVEGPGGVLIDLPLTQVDLAALVGRSRETVNRTLSSLTLRGRLRRRGRRFLLPNLETEAAG